MNFQKALENLNKGEALIRSGWKEDKFIFSQVPSIISKDVVPRMQSLPQKVKTIFKNRFEDPNRQVSELHYAY